MSSELEQQVALAGEKIAQLREQVSLALVGQHEVLRQVLAVLLAGGHVLVEGVPGLGKTLLVRALAKSCQVDFTRIQFTPDLMPSDVTGHVLYNMQNSSFEVRKGPVFTNFLLADEINRAPAKTQAALLEVMQERQITLEGEPHMISAPFMVLATQNPIEQEGTYPLPEAELDRFMMKVFIDYPSQAEEIEVVRRVCGNSGASGFNLDDLQPVMDQRALQTLQALVARVVVDEQIEDYAVRIVRETRIWPGFARGAGPRASIALISAARALALIDGSYFVTPDKVKEVAGPVLRHRVLLKPELEIEGVDEDQALNDLLRQVQAPRQ